MSKKKKAKKTNRRIVPINETLDLELHPSETDEILKVQKPVIGGGEILIYNEDRSIYGLAEPTPDIMMLLGTEFKVYVLGHIDENGILVVKEKLSWQPW